MDNKIDEKIGEYLGHILNGEADIQGRNFRKIAVDYSEYNYSLTGQPLSHQDPGTAH